VLYYRTHASRTGELPPELVGWESPCEEACLSENVVGEYRVLTIAPPFVFAPPTEGWVKLCTGWEVASSGVFTSLHHLRLNSKFLCRPTEVDGVMWSLPVVLNAAGSRGFKVVYGGPEFLPTLTGEQVGALVLATEVRTCHEGGNEPEMPLRARWAARLLPLTYCLSEASIATLGILSDDLIAATNAVAGGYDASPGK